MPAMIKAHVIEVRLDTIHRLFNSMDPSPFNERDLDHDAEEFIVSWAQEYPVKEPIRLVIHLHRMPEDFTPEQIEAAIRHYFAYRATISRMEFTRLMKEARVSLVIGISFLAVCLTLAHTVGKGPADGSGWRPILAESLTIAGWVAMWKPVDTALYRWWPVRRLDRIHRKLAGVAVKVRWDAAKENPSAPPAAEI